MLAPATATASAALAAAAVGLLALSPLPANAHVGAGFPGRMPPAMQARARRAMERRQVTYNDQSWQSVTVPSQECTAYSYAPVSSWHSSFPTAWVVADLVPGDTEAQNLYNKIAPGIPKIAPKGVPTNSMQGTTYNIQQDPDCWWTETKCTQPKQQGLKPDVTSCPEPRTWGLTFDDGPNCTHNAFYDFLKQNKQTATLFYIGSNVYDWPLQAQRGLTDGHLLACHTWSHRYTTSLNNSQVFSEFFYTVKVIKWVTGVTVTSWRPPYGDVDDRVRYIASQLGLETVLWDEDTDDWNVQPAGTAPTSQILGNYASIISQGQSAASGLVVLTHEINGYTMQLAMQEYPIIKKAFANIVPFQTCLNNTTPYKEDIVYPNFAEYIAGNIMPATVPSAQDITASSVASLNIGTASATYSVTDISPSSSASGAGSSGGSVASGGPSAGSGDKKSGSTPLDAAVGLAGAAMAGGAALLFV